MLPKFCGFVRLTVMTLADGGDDEDDKDDDLGVGGGANRSWDSDI